MEEAVKIFGVLTEKEKEECMKDMSKYQRELFKELETNEEKAKTYELNDLLYDFDKDFIEKLLEIELREYLKESEIEGNRLNGKKQINNLTIGERTISFNRPRLRKEKEFDSVIIPKRTRFIKDITEDVITLYGKNNSVNDIKEIMEKMLGIKISTATISKMVNTIKEEILIWRNRELERCYFTINIDCTYIKIRDNKNLVRHKIPVYVAIGTKLDGHKEIVGIYLGNEDEEKNVIDEMYDKDIGETSQFWMTVFGDLKDRGVEKVLFLVSDGLRGMEEVVKEEFKGTKYQRCVLHLLRNIERSVPKNVRGEVVTDFKKIYKAITKEESEEKYKEFIEKYKNKRAMIKKAEEYYGYIRPLFNEPVYIRGYIYTNNIVESTNSKIKRGFYGRGALPNVDAAINIIYMNVKELEEKWKKTKVMNWKNISEELMTIYYDEIKEYL